MKNGLIISACLLLFACAKQNHKELFNTFFEPYIDLVSGQDPNQRIQPFLDGMSLYNAGEFEKAISAIEVYSTANPDMAAPYFYMGICYMAIGKSAKGELMFDHLDNIEPNNFIDQSEWYTALCLLWSGQKDRCRVDLEKILSQNTHAYHGKATELLEAMDGNGI